MNRRTRQLVFDLTVMGLCAIGACYAAARASAPVEASSWEGAKQALQQVQAPAPTRSLCYAKLTVEIVDEQLVEVVALHWRAGDELIPVDGGVSLTVTEAISAATEPIAVLDPTTIPECAPVNVESP